MKCQATKSAEATVELPSQSPDGPYQLCEGAAERLKNLALRPLEWFNLAAIHGPFEHYLHDDFYTDDGEASQPKCDVTEVDSFPCPSLDKCAFDHMRLLDFALTRWHLTQTIVAALKCHSERLFGTIPRRFAATKNPWFHGRLVEVAGEVLGTGVKDWFGGVMRNSVTREKLRLLHLGHKCLPHDDGLTAALESLKELPKNELAGWCLVLAHFRDPTVLNWIEKNVHDPLTGRWGDLAAASKFEWERALKWLCAGRPLSLVALDAMVACSGPHPSQSFLIQKLHPRLHTNVDITEQVIAAELRAYAAQDPSPRAARAVRFITANLHTIISRQ